MSAHHCCQGAARGLGHDWIATRLLVRALGPTLLVRRIGEIVRWIVPSAILALMPKCPACLAAYVALWTGLGLSFSAATHLRTGLLIVCVALLLYVASKRLYLSACMNWRKP